MVSKGIVQLFNMRPVIYGTELNPISGLLLYIRHGNIQDIYLFFPNIIWKVFE